MWKSILPIDMKFDVHGYFTAWRRTKNRFNNKKLYANETAYNDIISPIYSYRMCM